MAPVNRIYNAGAVKNGIIHRCKMKSTVKEIVCPFTHAENL